MKQPSRAMLVTVFAFVFLASSNICAGDWLNNDEVRDLLSGNTITGFYIKESVSQAMMACIALASTAPAAGVQIEARAGAQRS